MNWKIAALIGIAVIRVCMAGQADFDAASVKVADPAVRFPRAAVGGPGSSAPGRYSVCAGLIDLLTTAYGVQGDQISGGQAWQQAISQPILYEVSVTMPPDTTKQRFQAMMQNLLAQRFHLTVHREMQDFPAFDLMAAKGGPKLKKASANAASGTAPSGPGNASAPRSPFVSIDRDGFPALPAGPRTGQILAKGNLRLKFQERSMTYFAGVLPSLMSRDVGAPPRVKMPRVNDKTGLTGAYDFTLEFACGDCVAASSATAAPTASGEETTRDGPGLFAALEKQLGLVAVKAKDIPLEVIVVDQVSKFPTPN